jgi:hypothetical protein
MKATQLTLEERIKALHTELEAVIAAFVDERAAVCPGVPRASVEATILARAEGCTCEGFRLVNERIRAAEELAAKQQKVEKAHAFPEG